MTVLNRHTRFTA